MRPTPTGQLALVGALFAGLSFAHAQTASQPLDPQNTLVMTLKDGKVIAYNGRETPTRGRELTILEQLLGNVGRGGMLPNRDDEGAPGQRPGDRR